MVRIKSTVIIAASLLALCAATTLSQATPPFAAPAGKHAQLRQCLEELGYEYKLFDDGSALLLVPGEDDQPVRIIITPEQRLPQGNVRGVVAIVAIYDGDAPPNLDKRVQRISGELPQGFLKVEKHNGKTLVIYGTAASANSSASQLGLIVRDAAKQARRSNQKLLVA
jgi:hypothetical protein